MSKGQWCCLNCYICCFANG